MPKSLQNPGSFLALVLEKYNLNPFKLSKDIHLSQSAVRMITIGKTKITTPVAMRLAKYFNTKPEYWLVMQMKWDIAEAAKDKALIKIVKSISKVKKGAAGGKDKTTAAKKPGAKKKTTKTRKTATKKRAAKPRKRGRPAATRAKTRKVVRKPAKRGRKPVATRAKTRKTTVKRGRKPGRKPRTARAKPAGRRGRPAKKK
jgi:addiction module HigA family antidote